MAHNRELEPEQSYSPGGTADAYEPLTVGARVHARHEASYMAYVSHAAASDAAARGVPYLSFRGEGPSAHAAGTEVTAPGVLVHGPWPDPWPDDDACDDDEVICMY